MRKLSVACLSLLLSLAVIGFLSTPVFTAETDEHPWDIDGSGGGDQGNGGTSPDTTDGPGGDDVAAEFFRSSGTSGGGLSLWFSVSFNVTSWFFDWAADKPVEEPAAATSGTHQTSTAR